LSRETGKRARRFKDLIWSTRDSWSRECRVVAKAEWIGGEANPRFVVTSLRQCAVVVEQPAIKPVNPLEPNPAAGPHRGEQGRGQRLELRRRARRAVEHSAEHLARQEIDVLGEHAEAQPVDGFIRMDPPEHDEQRKEASTTVNPMNLAKMESLIRGRTCEVLDGLPRDEEFNWVDRVSIELTSRMLATLFDYPLEDRRQLIRWSEIVITTSTRPMRSSAARRSALPSSSNSPSS
jgi:hypothetical protein